MTTRAGSGWTLWAALAVLAIVAWFTLRDAPPQAQAPPPVAQAPKRTLKEKLP